MEKRKVGKHVLYDHNPRTDVSRDEIITNIKESREIPYTFLYDDKGSEIFETITNLDEYYPFSKEIDITNNNIGNICSLIGSNASLIEFGSGSSSKTRKIIDNLDELCYYVPVDISKNKLKNSTLDLSEQYPRLDIVPICADYTKQLDLPSFLEDTKKVVYFPGTTIGNLYKDEVVSLLEKIALICGNNGGLLIGLDLIKNPNVIHRAYNDSKNVTAEFNKNILSHLNSTYGFKFELSNFKHYAFFNVPESRIEMHLVSTIDHKVDLVDDVLFMNQGDSLRTEVSYKYRIKGFSRLATNAGMKIRQTWTDNQEWFCILYMETL